MTKPTRKLDPGYNAWTPFWFLAPAVVALLAIGIYPTLFALVTSFREYQLTRPRSGFPFVGLGELPDFAVRQHLPRIRCC